MQRYTGRGGLLSRDSLRWRLPMLSGALLVMLVSAFLWAAYRQVEATLVAAGATRATAAAEELAERLSMSVEATMAATTRLAREPALGALLRDPTERTRDAARQALVPPGSPPALRRLEVWDTAGALVLELASPRADTARLQAFPRGARPGRPGIGALERAGRFAYFEILTELRADTTPGAARVGYLRRFGQLTSSGMSITRLLGSDAGIRIGVPGTATWTDLATVVDPVPAPAAAGEAHEYRAADGRRWLGGAAAIRGTPWRVWVEYPRTSVLAPARLFLRRMLAVALGFVAVSVALATLLGVRLTRPLHALATAAERIAGGDYTRRVDAGRRDEIGLLSRAFNTMTDRVEHAYDALRKSHEQTHFLLATARIGVWEARLDTYRVVCSDSMRLVHGRSEDPVPLTRAAFLEQVYPDDRDALRRVLEGRDAGAEVIDLQYRALAPDGSVRAIEGKARLKRDDHGQPVAVVGVSVDVTDRHRLESQLRQAQKMEAVGQLAGGVAHDFNNLLTVVTSYSSMLLAELPVEDRVRGDVEEIGRAADRAAALTRQLLAFSRQQVLEPRVLDLNAVVRDLEKMLGRVLREDVRLETALAPRLGRVHADPGQLEQVIVNLAVNARDAMPAGGALTIETADVELDGTYAHRHADVTPGPYVMLAVSDTGVGMDAATQARIFEPFFTTKEVGKGTGLGLSTVYGIVKQSGGHVAVYSEPGWGTTFKVYLPRASASPAARPRRDARPALHRGSGTILVVEDEASVRTVARRILERAGYTVLEAASGPEALRLCAEHAQDGAGVDLLLTDMVMPDMSGHELAARLRERHAAAGAVFMSGYTEDTVLRQGIIEAGAVFIQKPFTPETLTQKVREGLRGVGIGDAA